MYGNKNHKTMLQFLLTHMGELCLWHYHNQYWLIASWTWVKELQPDTNLIYFLSKESFLTHWGWVMHICVSKVTIVSDNGLSPGRHQAIIWNNAGILLIGPLGTNFTGILIEIHTFSFKKMHLKMSSGKWRPFCICLNVLIWRQWRIRT